MNKKPAHPSDSKWLAIWRHGPVVLNLILAGILAFATCNSDRTTTRQVELLHDVKKIIDDEVIVGAREDFNYALDDAEKFCISCSSCAPDYLIAVSLDKAVRVEPRAAEQLTAAEYNRLAMLGSYLWDFQKTEQYAKKALERSNTPLDRFMSELVLGHINFRHLTDDPKHANLDDGRKHFKAAIASLQSEIGSDAGQQQIGQGYALWAVHEAFLKNEADYKQQRDYARTSWSKLRIRDGLVAGLDERIEDAKAGTRPEIACLFKKPVPTCTATLAPKPAPAPTPALHLKVKPADTEK